MEETDFEGFKVYKKENKYCFIYLNFQDENKFLEGFVSYIFNEKNLLLYSEMSASTNFENLGKKEYTKLFKNISLFLNQDLQQIPLKSEDLDDKEIEKTLIEEYDLRKSNDDKYFINQNKIGMLGEYIFHLLMTKYFQYKIITPKFQLTTSRNMSVYGIDLLFYNDNENEIIFGESKLTKTLIDGIKLVNKSLEKYEEKIKEEYLSVISSDNFKLSNSFVDKYKNDIDNCKDFSEFVKKAKIENIIVPIFIAHGNKEKENINNIIEDIIEELNNIKSKKMLHVETKYLFISLPIKNKKKFIEYAIKIAKKKCDGYESKQNSTL